MPLGEDIGYGDDVFHVGRAAHAEKALVDFSGQGEGLFYARQIFPGKIVLNLTQERVGKGFHGCPLGFADGEWQRERMVVILFYEEVVVLSIR